MGFTFCNEFGNYLETPPIEIALERALNNLEFSGSGSRNQRKYEVEEIPIDSKDEDDDTSESNS